MAIGRKATDRIRDNLTRGECEFVFCLVFSGQLCRTAFLKSIVLPINKTFKYGGWIQSQKEEVSPHHFENANGPKGEPWGTSV